jgi:glycosyltransferase involved in cell wall biosynthesis
MKDEARALRATPSGTKSEPNPRPIKVLIVDTAIAFGGTLVVARNLLKHIDREVVDASLVSACSDGFVSSDFAGGPPVCLLAPHVDYVRLSKWKQAVHRTFRWNWLRRSMERLIIVAGVLANVPYTLKLAHFCRRQGIEILHANNFAAEPLWAARLAGIPALYHLHGFLPPTLERSMKSSFRHVAAFISISQAVTEAAVLAGVERARIRNVLNFVERVPDPIPPAMPTSLTIGIFGRVIPWKGQKQFLHAALRVLPKFPELRILIVGGTSDGDPDYMRECRGIAESSPYAHQIEFTGFVTDVEKYYRRCTIVVHASIEPEPFGMVLIEAMAQARPVIASTLGAASEIIDDGVDGFIIDPHDEQLMAARISELLANPMLATTLGLRGHRKVQALYHPVAGAHRFQQLYSDIARPTIVGQNAP